MISVLLTLAAMLQAEPADMPPPEPPPTVEDVEEVGDEGGRIVGGQNAGPRDAPWQMQLVWYDGKVPRMICGAVLIDPQWVLTARHCAINRFKEMGTDAWLMKWIRVRGGGLRTSGPMQEFQIARVVTFGPYEPPAQGRFWAGNDIMLLRLHTRANMGAPHPLQPVRLPRGANDLPQPQESVTVTGWGNTQRREAGVTLAQQGDSLSDQLKIARLRVMPPAECTAQNRTSERLPDTVICARFRATELTRAETEGVRTTCQGDSGGPLVFQGNGGPVLVGLVSAARGCSTFPTAFTNVGAYADAIRRAMAEAAPPAPQRR